MTWLERIRKRLFSATEVDVENGIFTAASGTQTIEIADLLLDEEVKKDMDKLEEILRYQREIRAAGHPTPAH